MKRGAHAAGSKAPASAASGARAPSRGSVALGRRVPSSKPHMVVGDGRATPAERGVRPVTGGARRTTDAAAPSRPRGGSRPKTRMPLVARLVWGCLATGVLLAVLGLFAFPTRTYLDQRRQLTAATHDVQTLNQQNEALQQRADQLHTDAEIERLAREQYHLVKPGERAFAILPAPTPTTTTLPPPLKHIATHPGRPGFPARTWNDLTSWL